MPQVRRGLAGLCAALTLLLALGGLAPGGVAGAAVAATGAHEAVAVVTAQHAVRTVTGGPEHPPTTSPASGVAVPEALAGPGLPAGRTPGPAAADAPVGRASRDRSPPVQS